VTAVESFDVVIVGGALMGSSAAYFITRSSLFSGRVLVLEQDFSYRDCSTARSAASIRQQFSTEINIRISQFGYAFAQNITDHLGEDAWVDFRNGGYLLLASDAGAAVLRDNHALQTQCGAEVAYLDAAALNARFPWLATDGVVAGTLGLSGEGWLDAYALLRSFRKAAQRQGAQYREARVIGLQREGGQICRLTLADGSKISCGAVINAAGPAAAGLAGTAGIHLPVEPRKRTVFYFECRSEAQPANAPLTVDPGGLWFRPEGAGFIVGRSPGSGEPDPACSDLEPDYQLWEERIWPELAARVPVFEAVRMVNAWAGHYAYNTLDQNAIVGPHPEIGNFYFANGFSGHGLQQAPAVGRGLAEILLYGHYRSLDLSPLGFARILENAPLLEKNVI
jgi:glycine/D-amino acid oxidase-like deaminating enzyme